MGFSEHFINMVWNLVSNNWYSVLVNGKSSGFFKSTRGVKQGDPLSPALFILLAEVLSRSLISYLKTGHLWDLERLRGPLNHLAYADDTIIFASAHPSSLSKIMAVLLSFHGWYKCNTDGASKGNPGLRSLGFCVRNDEGDVVYARAVDLGVTTNVVAEAKAILQGLEYCVEHDLHPLILEIDSLVMKKVIEGEWDPP
uniref:Uncharacterized protein LOC104240345 n=1 Tax=Nicotiana sylvestris TaxID=4096 RepID=A0A1U7XN69_NICSY|nr:PREDICTED: uncharacterized protein LOC104240345 [Nicotiana sylvestris]